MNGIKLKINENSETIKKFSVFKDNITYFTNSYLIFLIVSTFLCVYLAYTGQIMYLNYYEIFEIFLYIEYKITYANNSSILYKRKIFIHAIGDCCFTWVIFFYERIFYSER